MSRDIIFADLRLLPTEIVYKIFGYLPPWIIFKYAQANPRLRQIGRSFYTKSSLIVETEKTYEKVKTINQKTLMSMVQFWARNIRSLEVNISSDNPNTMITFNGLVFRTEWDRNMENSIIKLIKHCSHIVSLTLNIYTIINRSKAQSLIRHKKNLQVFRLIGHDIETLKHLVSVLPESVVVLEFNGEYNNYDVIQTMNKLKNAKEIKISMNTITPEIIESLVGSSERVKLLRTLHLYGLKSSASRIKSLSKLVNLEELNIEHSGEAATDDVLCHIMSHCTKIRRLMINGKSMDRFSSATVQNIFTHLPKLKELRLSWVNLRELLPVNTKMKASDLTVFSVAGCTNLSADSILRFVQKAPKLKKLFIYYCYVSRALVEYFVSSSLERNMHLNLSSWDKEYLIKNKNIAGVFSPKNTCDLAIISSIYESSNYLENEYFAIIANCILRHELQNCMIKIKSIPRHKQYDFFYSTRKKYFC